MAGLQGMSGAGRQQGVALRDLVYVVFRRRLVVLGVLLPILVVASLGLFQETGSSIAACKILIELQAPETPRWNPGRYGIDYDRTLSTLMHMAMSAPVARQAAEALQDSLEIITRLDNGAFAHLANHEELAGFIFERLSVSPTGESSILTMRFGSRNSRLSIMSLAACRDAFLKYAITATRNTHALEYYNDQVRIVREDLDDLLRRRSQVVARAGYGTVETDLPRLSQQLADLRHNQFRTMLDRVYLESRVKSMRHAQAQDPEYCPSPNQSGIGITMINTKSQVERLRSELQAILSRYTEDHIEVRRARERLDGARRVLAAEVESYIQTFEQDLEALRIKEQSMTPQIEALELATTAVPELSRQVELFDNEIRATSSLLRDLQIKRGEVLMNTGADERIASIIKLTEPEIEVIISEARKFIYFAVIMVFGLIFAVIVGLVVDSRDHRLHSPDRVEAHLGVPVLAAVSDEKTRSAGP